MPWAAFAARSAGARRQRRRPAASRSLALASTVVTSRRPAGPLRPDPRRRWRRGSPSAASPPTAPARSPTPCGAAAARPSSPTSRTLPAALRAALEAAFRFDTVADTEIRLADGGLTEKALHRLDDGALIESVLMHYPARGRHRASGTRCASRARPAAPSAARSARPASSASGATSRRPRSSTRSAHAARRLAADGQRLTNIVFMGMGEPLLNLDRVLAAVEALNDPAAVRPRRAPHHGLHVRRRARDPAADRARAAVHAGGLAPRRARRAARRARAAQPALAGRRGRRRRPRPRRGDRPADQLRGHDDRRRERHASSTPTRWPSSCAATTPTSTSSR